MPQAQAAQQRPAAEPQASAASGAVKLYLASARNLGQRLIAYCFVATALVPCVPHLWAALWLAGLAVVLPLQIRVVQLSKRASLREDLAGRLTVLAACLNSAHYALAVTMLWAAGAELGRLFAVVVTCVSAMYILMQYYARPRQFLAVVTPLLAVIGLGFARLMVEAFASGAPWTAIAGLMAIACLLHFLFVARGQLARSRNALREARRRAQDQSQAAEAANAAKSTFLATMSHEIRTPLNGVLGMVQAMAADELTDVQGDRLDVVRQSGEALLAILNDVLDLSKIEAGRLELEAIDFELEEIARGAHAAFTAIANKQGLSFDLLVTPEAAGAYCGDPVRVRQILYNLVSNALKFTKVGEIRVRVEREDGLLKFTVSDTGVGIAPERLEALFSPFVQADASTTRKFGGTGLGLSICRELASLMGGSIKAESELGVGSRFIVSLPLQRAASPQADRAPAQPPATPVLSLRVLAAEDNTVNQLVLRTLLHQVGLEPVIVSDGQQVLEAWREQPWDVILMDVQMPGLDGPAAARLIRQEEAVSGRPRTPIIALTANTMSHQIAEYLAAGMDDHISKPIAAAQLYSALQSAVDADEAASSAA